jgi:hypothetical protein
MNASNERSEMSATRKAERRRQSRDVIYDAATKFASTLLTIVTPAEDVVVDEVILRDMADKVMQESSIMALTLWDSIDDRIEEQPDQTNE